MGRGGAMGMRIPIASIMRRTILRRFWRTDWRTKGRDMPDTLISTIEAAWENRAELGFSTEGAVRAAVAEALNLLASGNARVAEPAGEGWPVNQWLKKAVLLSFRLNDNALIPGGTSAEGPTSAHKSIRRHSYGG